MTREGEGTVSTPLDLRRTTSSLGGALDGYGLTPSAARERAAVVRAVTQDQHIRQRPMPVVIVTGLIALAGLVTWACQLYLTFTDETPLSPLFWAGLAAFLVAAAVCSWAWQLYDVRKAVVMWLAIVALTVAAALIIVIVLVALKGDGDADVDLDLDGLLDRITGSGGAGDGARFVDQVVAPVILDTADSLGGMRGGTFGEVADAAPSEAIAPPGTPACPSCGRALTPGLLVCPRCGSRLDGLA